MSTPVHPWSSFHSGFAGLGALRVFAVTVFTFYSAAFFCDSALAADRSKDLSLRLEVRRAIDRGLASLAQTQNSNGWWSTADHPAVTALALVAHQWSPDPRAKSSATATNGYAYILRCVQPDGGIYSKPELKNYNTAVSLLALSAAQRDDWKPIIRRARQFLIGSQIDLGKPGELDNPHDGGIGYGSGGEFSDMSNTLMALEALYHSKKALPDEPKGEELNWGAVLQFIQNCQNLPGYNKQPWASDDPQNKGGFVYHPTESKAGETNLPSGKVALRSYGSISYAGLLSYIYVDLDKGDPRVQAVVEWLGKNFTLEENPGMGQQGLYYYYHTMAKALSAAGIETLNAEKPVTWRPALALKLMDLQRTDGSWYNDTGGWWEKEPALVTAYSLIALEIIERGL